MISIQLIDHVLSNKLIKDCRYVYRRKLSIEDARMEPLQKIMTGRFLCWYCKTYQMHSTGICHKILYDKLRNLGIDLLGSKLSVKLEKIIST